MDEHTASEQAFTNGYSAGYAAGRRSAGTTGETSVLINRADVSWSFWEYLCVKCGADAFKTKELLLYITGSVAEGYQTTKEVER